MIANAIQNNFASGELSPDLWARTDRPFYKSGLEKCKNFTPALTGDISFRRGTEYSIHSRLNSDPWGLPFRFNIDQSYSLEFTNYKLRIHADGGVILEAAKNITGITQANPGVLTVTSHGYSEGDEVFINDVGGMIALNQQFYLVKYIDANTFSLTDVYGVAYDTTLADAFTSGGTVARVYEVTSPYTIAEAKKLRFCGTADLMYLYCPTREPRVLTRSGSTSWSIATYSRYSSTLAITGVTKASPGVVTSAAHGLSGGERIYISHIEGMTELNAQEFLVTYIDGNTFSLKTIAGAAVDTTAYTTYKAGGDVAIVRAAPKSITTITKANPGVLTVTGHGLSTNDKIYIESVGGMTELNGNFYWVKKVDANSFSLMTELGVDVNTTAYTTFTAGGTITYVRGLFTRIGDFPSACGLYGGRFVAGGTEEDPDVFWLSMGPDADTGSSQYDDFTIGTDDTDGMVYTLTSQNYTADRIRWFSGTPSFLVLGSSGGVYKANGGADGAAITPTSILVTPVSSVGVADLSPLNVDNQIYYLEQGALTLRGFGYSILDDEYKAFDKNVLADEITQGGILQLAHAKGRPELIYAIRADGVLLSCTILEQNDVAGWAPIELGGDGKALSIVTEPQTTGFDRVGVFVQRTINSQTAVYLEYLTEDPILPDFSDFFTGEDNQAEDKAKFEKVVFEAQKQFVRLDSALILDTTQNATLTLGATSGNDISALANAAVFTADDVGKFIFAKFVNGDEAGIAEIITFTSTTLVQINIRETFSATSFAVNSWYLATNKITGLGHLEGETVSILTDGGVHPDETVTDGEIDLDYPARYIIVGFGYIGFVRTLDLEIPLAAGVSQSRLRSVEKMFLKLRNSLGGKFGVTKNGSYKLVTLGYRRAGSSYYDRPPTLFNGLKQVPIFDTWDNEKHFYIIQDQPLPLTVLAIIPSEDIGEEE